MLYNEERPAKLSEMIGQGQNLEIFRKQISDGYFSHAYLFAGHHGSGKTTSARILAKAAVLLKTDRLWLKRLMLKMIRLLKR